MCSGHGYSVFSINPNQLDELRDRHTVAGAKDDRRDAFVLADSLRTDLPLFRRLQQESAQIIRLRELSRLEDDLAQDHNRLINQLREQLHRYFPQLLQISSAAEDAWVWDLIEIAPVPAVAADPVSNPVSVCDVLTMTLHNCGFETGDFSG